MIRNKYLRIACIPLALLSWSIQFIFFAFLVALGIVPIIVHPLMVLLFGDEIEWELLLIVFVLWWAYYPWLWWYRYFTTGQLSMLEEFKEH
jgi:hypothetical protein